MRRRHQRVSLGFLSGIGLRGGEGLRFVCVLASALRKMIEKRRGEISFDFCAPPRLFLMCTDEGEGRKGGIDQTYQTKRETKRGKQGEETSTAPPITFLSL